jgi:hypothetical protein
MIRVEVFPPLCDAMESEELNAPMLELSALFGSLPLASQKLLFVGDLGHRMVGQASTIKMMLAMVQIIVDSQTHLNTLYYWSIFCGLLSLSCGPSFRHGRREI